MYPLYKVYLYKSQQSHDVILGYFTQKKKKIPWLYIKNLRDLLYTANGKKWVLIQKKKGKKWVSILHVSDIFTLQCVQ